MTSHDFLYGALVAFPLTSLTNLKLKIRVPKYLFGSYYMNSNTPLKSNVREFYQTQGYWKVVKQTLRFLDSADKLRRLLENSKWASQDATTRIYIKINISDEDKTSVQDLEYLGAIWKYLMDRYKWISKYDIVVTLQKVTQWQKDAKISIESSLQQLEQLNAELYEISNKEMQFNKKIILTLFLDRLPNKYKNI